MEIFEKLHLTQIQNIFDLTGGIIIGLDINANVSIINKQGLKILGYKTENELLGKDWFDCCIEQENKQQLHKIFSKIISGDNSGFPIKHENKIIRKDGSIRNISWFNTTMKDNNSNIIGCLSSGLDITEIRRNELQIEKDLKEKEMLIKEIHHRVKNNNQLLISLFHLQSMKTRSKVGRQILDEATKRIKAISLTYEKLYINQNLTEINLSRYIKETVSDISLAMLTPYGISIERNIEKNIMVENINKVTPISLIINELLSNISKHAFPNIIKGKKVKISLTNNDGTVTFIIEDNGVGLPANYNIIRQGTMGTMLIKTLTSQLGGHIVYKKAPKQGAKVVLKFKIK